MQFVKNEKGCIMFTDLYGISHDTWEKIFYRINYLGYGMPDIESVIAYFSKPIYLQPDQSLEVLKIFGQMQDTSEYSKEQIQTDIQNAVDYFGLTDSFKLAGYILTDGRLLNMSAQGYSRDTDHREISHVLEIDPDKESDLCPIGSCSYAGMVQFVNYGNIRLFNNGFELAKRPTQSQRRAIAKLIREQPEIYADIANNKGLVVTHFEHSYENPVVVLNDIDSYFDAIEI